MKVKIRAEVVILDKILNSKFQRGLRHSAMWTLSSMVLFLQEYCKLCFSKWMKKWKFVMWWKPFICYISFIQWILKKKWMCCTHFILWKSTICCILIICWLLIIWDNYNFQDTSAHPPVHSLAVRPFEEQPHYMMMKSHHM